MDASGWGAIGSMVTSAMAPYQQHRDAMIRQHQSQDYGKEMYSNRYQMTVQDLQKAGLNPMLAYQQGAGSVPSASAPSGANFDTDPFGKYVSTKLTSAQEANIRAETRNKEAMTGQIEAQTSLFLASAQQSRTMTQKLDAEIANVKQELQNLQAQLLRDVSNTYLNQQQELTQRKLEFLYAQQASLVRNQVLVSDPKASAAQGWSGTAAAYGENISRALSPVSDFVGKFRLGGNDLPRYRHYGPNDY